MLNRPDLLTFRTMLDDTVARLPQATVLKFCRQGTWQSLTYSAFNIRVRQVAEVIGRMSVVPGRDHVALILENRPEWMEISAGLLCTGVTLVPLDDKLRAAEASFILENADVVAIFAHARHLSMLTSILPALPSVRHVVLVDGESTGANHDAHWTLQDYEAALSEAASDAQGTDAWIEQHRPDAETVASIIFTSGTTGKPKGAMLSHKNFCADVAGAIAIIGDLHVGDCFFMVLPLFHTFSFTANFLVPISYGGVITIVSSLRTLGQEMLQLRPTVLFAVPLLIEKMYTRIEERLQGNKLSRLLLAVGLGRIIGWRVRKSMGGKLKLLVVGGAPCPVHVLRGLRKIGIPIIEGYGLTEASPVVSLSRSRDARPGTIGYKLPNIEVRIAEPDAQGVGELQVRGPIVMKGYYKNPTATADVFDGEWLRTGDLASMDEEGYITIRGRKKALIVNREGKNIYPEEVEQYIAKHHHILDVVVVGYHEGQETGERVGAIVVPNLDAIQASCGHTELEWATVESMIRQVVQQQCLQLSDYKRPRKVDVRREPLDRTSIQKVRRHLYQGALDTPS